MRMKTARINRVKELSSSFDASALQQEEVEQKHDIAHDTLTYQRRRNQQFLRNAWARKG